MKAINLPNEKINVFIKNKRLHFNIKHKMLQIIQQDFDCSIYQIESTDYFKGYFLSTPETRHLCCDLTFTGHNLEHGLKQALSRSLAQLKYHQLLSSEENQTTLLLPSSASLAFPIREALQESFGWNRYNTFFSLESPLPLTKQLWIVDQGKDANFLSSFDSTIKNSGDSIEQMVFLTFGTKQYLEALKEKALKWNQERAKKIEIKIFFFEGVFDYTEDPISQEMIFSKDQANLAPEYVDAHYYSEIYAIEKDAIGSLEQRVFTPMLHLQNQKRYWNTLIEKAQNGFTYNEAVKQKYPFIDGSAFGDISLEEKATEQVNKIEKLL